MAQIFTWQTGVAEVAIHTLIMVHVWVDMALEALGTFTQGTTMVLHPLVEMLSHILVAEEAGQMATGREEWF